MTKVRGFTLIEILVGVAIGAIVALGVTELFLQSMRAQHKLYQWLSSEQAARRTLLSFAADLRPASYAATGAYPLESATTNTIIFYSNVDSDAPRERVRYFLNGGALKKGITEPTGSPPVYDSTKEVVQTMVSPAVNGTTSLFSYYDQAYIGSGVPLPTPIDITKVRLVGIDLRAGDTSTPFILQTKVEIRNLKSN